MVTLRSVLESLQSGESLSVQLLAGKLEDSPGAVQSALEILEQMGKVRRIPVSLHCGHGCAGCAGSCPHRAEKKTIRWELNE